jgi:NAD(P)-dependent dehydrogenase (short-subunit alcohol dehydrogenase family)
MIRVNSIHPTTVDTPMVQNPALYDVFGMPAPAGSKSPKPSNH